ncbi:MAG TPA: radical SAM protein [Desulfobacteraceae bacterium]|nr:radical SAM protein [Desulfobacteraceae bacterium]
MIPARSNSIKKRKVLPEGSFSGRSPDNLPSMLYADEKGRIYDHPLYRMAGFSGAEPFPLSPADMIDMPEFSKLFFIPDCPPVGLDPETGRYVTVRKAPVKNGSNRCFAVAAFLEPGLVRSHLPAADYSGKKYILPTWAYTAVGYRKGCYVAAGFCIEYNHRWDPRNYDDHELVPAIKHYRKTYGSGKLVDHLAACATMNHCFAAKNMFLERWEAPLPVSRTCNAACLGCISLQPEGTFEASHHRIDFRPSKEEITALAVRHLEATEEGIVSFGQGCEGEPLMESGLIAESVREIRKRTGRGTINLNTNGSLPEKVREIAESGLDSIRISLSSARPDCYTAYHRPRTYRFEDVETSIAVSRRLNLYTMVNYLVFPGITDQKDEMEALSGLIERTGLDFVHLKNLCIDPDTYLKQMPAGESPAGGMKVMAEELNRRFPDLKLGYFNQPVRK